MEITARTEEDVMPALILKKVRDSSGAKFSHEQRQVDLPENMRTHIADTGPEKTV